MGEAQHQTTRQIASKTRSAFIAGLAAIGTVATVFVAVSLRPKSIEWFPYSPAAVAENASEGKSSAVIYYARWTLSSGPKGGVVTPAVSLSLADAGFVTMSADLTDSSGDSFRDWKKQGFDTLPVLVLYPTTGPRVAFGPGDPESEIVSKVKRFSR